MKSKTLTLITAMTLFATLAIPGPAKRAGSLSIQTHRPGNARRTDELLFKRE